MRDPRAACSPTWGSASAVGADEDGYPGILGYQGPRSARWARRVEPLGAVIESHDGAQERSRDRADPRERALVRARAPAAAGVLAAGRDRGRGRAARAGHEATLAMLEALGADVRPAGAPPTASRPATAARSGCAARGRTPSRTTSSSSPATCSSRETSAPIWGYNAELERAMVIGPPTDEMRRLFDHTVAAQQAAFDALRPGVTCADVDGAVMRYFEDNDLAAVLAPARRARDRPAQPRGAVPRPRRPHADRARAWCSRSSPASTTPAIGGFRHSDTVAVTADGGIDMLTDYPRDLESLTIPV